MKTKTLCFSATRFAEIKVWLEDALTERFGKPVAYWIVSVPKGETPA
ncbi:hypothetical protein [Terricaulis sp.]|nr:hypothetical protein [Terricaulis sp.]MDZ4692263.1 hypothetical protein [Terricaulis sp.]